MLYLHGGGYALGSLNTHRVLVSWIARAAKTRALAIDYRLAPEYPFPAAIEDSVAAYRWLLSIGADPTRMTIAGDSAGGGLAVATLISLRDAGTPLPAAAVCISPWVDMEVCGESIQSKADVDPMLERKGILELAQIYLGGTDPRHPLASPIHADLKGLPPLLIQVGTAEALLDDAVRLARCGQSAGVKVVLEQWQDMIHVWHTYATILPEARQAIQRIGEFVQEHTS
jgi:acetyl esterase/lipase